MFGKRQENYDYERILSSAAKHLHIIFNWSKGIYTSLIGATRRQFAVKKIIGETNISWHRQLILYT